MTGPSHCPSHWEWTNWISSAPVEPAWEYFLTSPQSLICNWGTQAGALSRLGGKTTSFTSLLSFHVFFTFTFYWCFFVDDIMLLLTFSAQLFLSLTTQTLRSVVKVENSRCRSHGGRCQGPTGRILLLPPHHSPAHGWGVTGVWAGGQGPGIKMGTTCNSSDGLCITHPESRWDECTS